LDFASPRPLPSLASPDHLAARLNELLPWNLARATRVERSLIMAAHVFTISRVAEILGEDEDW
jgi:hypothetical protein